MGRYLSISLSIVIILIFGYTLFNNALNVPSYDDYNATLGFIREYYFDSASPVERIKLLFNPHNEHCILFSRASAATYYYFFKEINFAHLVIFQNLFLIGFLCVILAIIKLENQLFLNVLLLVTLILFNLSFWQVSFYYWAGIQHYTVFFFSFLSLLMLSKAVKPISWPFLAAVSFAFCAVFSFGNGFLALFLGIFLLWAQRKHLLFWIWGGVSLGIIAALFIIRNGTPIQSVQSALNPDWMARLLFAFLGSFLFVNPNDPFWHYANIICCMVAGVAVLGIWIFLFFKGYALRNPLLYVLFSLPILTGIIISISRFETKAAGGVAPRYMFFTASIPIMLILILTDLKILKRRSLNMLTGFWLLVWGLSFYNNTADLHSHNQDLLSTVKKWEKDHSTALVYYLDAASISGIMEWAVEQKVVQLPSDIAGKEVPGITKSQD